MKHYKKNQYQEQCWNYKFTRNSNFNENQKLKKYIKTFESIYKNKYI